MHDLNIVDKHKALLAFGAVTIIQGIPIGEPIGFASLPDLSAVPLNATHVPVTMQPIYNFGIAMSYNVIFRDNALFGVDHAVPALQRLHGEVQAAVAKALAAFFQAEAGPEVVALFPAGPADRLK